MKEKSVSFEDLKKKIIGEGKVEEEAWSSVQDIPKSQIFALIKRLKTGRNARRFSQTQKTLFSYLKSWRLYSP